MGLIETKFRGETFENFNRSNRKMMKHKLKGLKKYLFYINSNHSR